MENEEEIKKLVESVIGEKINQNQEGKEKKEVFDYKGTLDAYIKKVVEDRSSVASDKQKDEFAKRVQAIAKENGIEEHTETLEDLIKKIKTKENNTKQDSKQKKKPLEESADLVKQSEEYLRLEKQLLELRESIPAQVEAAKKEVESKYSYKERISKVSKLVIPIIEESGAILPKSAKAKANVIDKIVMASIRNYDYGSLDSDDPILLDKSDSSKRIEDHLGNPITLLSYVKNILSENFDFQVVSKKESLNINKKEDVANIQKSEDFSMPKTRKDAEKELFFNKKLTDEQREAIVVSLSKM